MREISFRGRSIETREWYYGCLLNTDGKIPPYVPMIAVSDGIVYTLINADPDTVGQYTGIFTMDDGEDGDTECTFIYEGDIVEPVLIDGNHKGFSWGRQVVIFDRGAFCLKDRRGEITPMCNYAANVKFKVWGNIHDNPELLEV